MEISDTKDKCRAKRDELIKNIGMRYTAHEDDNFSAFPTRGKWSYCISIEVNRMRKSYSGKYTFSVDIAFRCAYGKIDSIDVDTRLTYPSVDDFNMQMCFLTSYSFSMMPCQHKDL